MNIAINTQVLARKLRFVEKIVSQKTIIPIYANVLLRAEMGELTLSSTNMEISLTTSCAATVTAPGVITAPVKPLLNLVNQLDDEVTHLIVEKGHVRIASGAFKMRLQTLSAEDFPRFPETPSNGVLLPGDLFKSMINRVRYAISDADKRYFMNGALLALTESTIALVSTDGKRMSLTAIKRDAPGECFEIALPTKALDVLAADEHHDDIMLARDERQLFFVTEGSILIARQVEGTFPNYKRVIPQENTFLVDAPRLLLLAALCRVALAAPDTRAVTLHVEGDTLALTSANLQMGDASEHVAITYNGPPLKMAFDWNYIVDFLEAAAGASVILALKDATTGTLWKDGEAFLNVIMQMRA